MKPRYGSFGSQSLRLLNSVLLVLNTCTAMEPFTVARDRFDYVNAMSESCKSQILLNLIKIRDMDASILFYMKTAIALNERFGTGGCR